MGVLLIVSYNVLAVLYTVQTVHYRRQVSRWRRELTAMMESNNRLMRLAEQRTKADAARHQQMLRGLS